MVLGRNKGFLACFLVLSFIGIAVSCVARPGTIRRDPPRRPFYLREQVPPLDEFSEGASGKPRKPIGYDTPEFRELNANYNPGIVFDHRPEGLGDTRRMTKRCMERLNKLAKLVKQRWNRTKLMVLSAWADKNTKHHAIRSLHYEGRAVDITTSDRDRSKLGLLARMAVEAGFDWVRYIQKYRVHASVRADDKRPMSPGVMGCFRSNSTVRLENGKTTTMERLKIGDRVESMGKDGKIIYSEIVMFMDSKPRESDVLHFVLKTKNPRTELFLTKSHLVYVRRRFSSLWGTQFAKMVQKGDFVNVWSDGKLVPAEVIDISVSRQRGAIAPLTSEGNIVVDNVLASCYALLDDHDFVNSIFWPAKVLYRHFPSLLNSNKPQEGVHWYARLLLFLNSYLAVLT